MSVTALPVRGESIGKGGFGEVFVDPDDESLCIKVFSSPLRGPDAGRLLDLVALAARMRPSEQAFLTSRFAWPLEAFGTERKLLGYRMPRVPESGVFDLIVAGRASMQVLQAKYLLDPSWWARAAVESEPPEFVEDGGPLLVADALRAFRLLHQYGFAYEDLSSNNVCVLNESLPRVFLLDADSVIPIDGADRGVVRSVDWEVDENLDPSARDWVKAAIFAWRMLLRDRLARPDRAGIADFDTRTGSDLGAWIVELHERPGIDAVDQLLEAISTALSPDSENGLIEQALDTGYAREVLRYRHFPQMTAETRSAAEAQIALEERVEQSTGLQRRLMLRGLTERGRGAFHLDVVPRTVDSVVPRSAEELERIVLAAEFDGLLDHFLDGNLSTLEGHPWRDRAIQHALVMEPSPEVETADIQGVRAVRFHWPAGELIDAARMRIESGGVLVDERLIQRQRGNSSVRIRGIGAGFPEGQRLDVRIAFCVRGDDGTVVECPNDAALSVLAPASDLRPSTRSSRTVRIAERQSQLAGEAAVDVARPDPNAPRARRSRRLRLIATGAATLAVAVMFLLRDPAVPHVLDAAAVDNGGGTDIVWVVRTSPEDAVFIRDFRVQRRILGPLWIGRDHVGGEFPNDPGAPVRVSTSASGTLRIRAELAGGAVLRSEPLTPAERPRQSGAVPDVATGLSWTELPGGGGVVSWELPDPGESRIIDRVQLTVLDTQRRRLLLTSSSDLGVTIPAAVVGAAPNGLVIRMRVTTSDGLRSDWFEMRTDPVDAALLPVPRDVVIVGEGTEFVELRWSFPNDATGRFEVRVSDGRRGERRIIEVQGGQVPLADLFEEGSGVRIVRVRAVYGDGAVGPWSAARIVRSSQAQQGS